MSDPAACARHLIDLADADLRLRGELAATGALFGGYHPDMQALHVRNAHELASIIDMLGDWPHEGLVGKEASAAAWLIAQHAISLPDFQRRVLALLLACAGVVPREHRALLTDRIRCFEGRAQIYGTQFDWDDAGQLSPLPIEDVATVDLRRAEAGLCPLAERTAELRREALEHGQKPPADLAGYHREKDLWTRSVGWRATAD